MPDVEKIVNDILSGNFVNLATDVDTVIKDKIVDIVKHEQEEIANKFGEE